MEILAMSWWMWILLGLVLLVGEILTPGGFYIIFFGFGAICVGLLSLLGIQLGLAAEGLIFAIVSVTACALFRKPLLERFRRLTPEITVDTLIGETAIAKVDLPAGATGKVELRGTSWNARNAAEVPINKDQRCLVESVEGLTLLIRPI
jgi:membrane protein implicated in regulation of membrane protease activity